MENQNKIYFENQDLEKIIAYISQGLSYKHRNIEYFIGSFIVNDPNNIIGKCPLSIKLILDKLRFLILTNESDEQALRLLVLNWDVHFEFNFSICKPYKIDFETIFELVKEGELLLDIFLRTKTGSKG